MRALVAAGELGAKTGKGFYENGEPRIGRRDGVRRRRARAALRAEGVRRGVPRARGRHGDRARHRPRHDGRRRADPAAVRARRPDRPRRAARRSSRRAAGEWGERFAPPTILRRLVAQGRLGAKTGQGFFAYARPDESGLRAGRGRQARDARRRRDRVDGPPAGELAVAAGHRRAHAAVGPRRRRPGVARARHLLGEPDAVVRGRGHQGVHEARRDVRRGDALRRARAAAADGALLDADDRRRQRGRVRRRLRAGDGLRRADRGAVGELRPARDQPRDHPRLRRDPAPAAPRRHGARALELNLTGDPISAAEAFEIGLVNRVVPDHELHDAAMAWARKLAGQAPLAVQAIKRTTAGDADLDEGIEAEKAAFAEIFATRRRARGHRRVPRQAPGGVEGRVAPRPRGGHTPARGSTRSAGVHTPAWAWGFTRPRGCHTPARGHTPARDLGAPRPDEGRAHRRLARGPVALLGLLRHIASRRSATSCPTARMQVLVEAGRLRRAPGSRRGDSRSGCDRRRAARPRTMRSSPRLLARRSSAANGDQPGRRLLGVAGCADRIGARASTAVAIVPGDSFNASRIATTVVVPLTGDLRLAAAPGNVVLSAARPGCRRTPWPTSRSCSASAPARSFDRIASGHLTVGDLQLLLAGIDLVLGARVAHPIVAALRRRGTLTAHGRFALAVYSPLRRSAECRVARCRCRAGGWPGARGARGRRKGSTGGSPGASTRPTQPGVIAEGPGDPFRRPPPQTPVRSAPSPRPVQSPPAVLARSAASTRPSTARTSRSAAPQGRPAAPRRLPRDLVAPRGAARPGARQAGLPRARLELGERRVERDARAAAPPRAAPGVASLRARRASSSQARTASRPASTAARRSCGRSAARPWRRRPAGDARRQLARALPAAVGDVLARAVADAHDEGSRRARPRASHGSAVATRWACRTRFRRAIASPRERVEVGRAQPALGGLAALERRRCRRASRAR